MALTAEQKRLYARQGYLIVRSIFGPRERDGIRRRFAALVKRWPKLYPVDYRLEHMTADPFWLRLAADPKLLGLVKPLLRGQPLLFSAAIFHKPPGSRRRALWHQDGIFWHLTLWPLEIVSVTVAVDDYTRRTGCLRMLPGSHREGRLIAHGPNSDPDAVVDVAALPGRDEIARAVDLELAAGDVSLHHPFMVHCSRPNTSRTPRTGILLLYTSTASRLTRPYTLRRVRGLRVNVAPLPDDTAAMARAKAWH